MRIFLGFLYLYRKKVVWIVGWDWDEVGESVDFYGVLRYLGRYWDFCVDSVESVDFVGVLWDLS